MNMQAQAITGFQLAPQQKRLWNLQQNSSAFCCQCSIVIEGNLQPDILQAAIKQVVQNHDILRTNFSCLPGIKYPVMVVTERSGFNWEYLDLSDCLQSDIDGKIQELFWVSRQEYKNLSEDYPLSLSLVKLSHEQHILIITLPSLCADTRTIKNLVNQINQAYIQCCKSEEFSQEYVQYVQFSEWQNQLLVDEDAQTAKEYWKTQQTSSLSTLKLPGERRGNNQQFVTDKFKLTLNQELTEAIFNYGQKHQVSVEVMLLACWHILIWRLTGESEIVVGTASPRREYEELDDTLGLLATWLPIKTKLISNLRFAQVLAAVTQTLENAAEWQDYFTPEAMVVDSSIAFPIGFEFAKIVHQASDAELSFTLDNIYSVTEAFKIKLTCLQQYHKLSADIYYDINCFDRQTMQRIATTFQTLLANAIYHSEVSISQLEILNNQEKQKLIFDFNQTDINYSLDKCIHDLFVEQAITNPDNIAIIYENQEITYSELNRKANRLAHYLQKQGVEPESVVGLCVERSLEMIVGLLGIIKASGAYLPLEPNLPTEALKSRLQTTQASLVVTQQSLVNHFAKEKVIAIDTDWEIIARESDDNPISKATPENLFYVIFTSGSTGKPKGVATEHRQLLNYINAIADRISLPKSANYATVSSLSADLGNTMIFPALCTGGCLHIISSAKLANAVELAEYCCQHTIDCLKIVPSHLTALLDATPAAISIIPRQCLILGGETASWKLISRIQQQAPNCQIFNHYGPTETTIGVLTYKVGNNIGDVSLDTVPLGTPLANTQVYILDEQLQPLPIGVSGELYIGGAGLARGYFQQPELTTQRFISHTLLNQQLRLYKTGDRGRYLEDGNIEFLGRCDNQVKIRGFRIELEEIELTLAQHPNVQQAVAAIKQSKNSPILIAYIVPQFSAEINVNELRIFLRSKLPKYMIPSTFGLLRKLPLTSNGKVDRKRLPDIDKLFLEEAKYEPPQTEIEQGIAQLWQQLLQREKIGINDNFFEVGGHSLLLVQAHVKLQEMFNIDIAITDLFAYPTIKTLVAYLSKSQPELSSLTESRQRAINRRNVIRNRRNQTSA